MLPRKAECFHLDFKAEKAVRQVVKGSVCSFFISKRGKHQLALLDVGIEPVHLEYITREYIELTQEAVIAECTSVTNVVPSLFSGCCCK